MGKSLLLAEAAQAAVRLGFTPVQAVADEFARTIPLSPLLLALSDLDEPSEQRLTDHSDPDSRGPGIQKRLENLLRRGPVLVTADDLQHADPLTLHALRVLPGHLAASSLCWILARSTDSGPDDAGQLFDLLERDGAARVPLGPLPEAVIADMVADQLGAIPDRQLLSLANAAGGNPFLVGELVRGLREEGLLATSGGRVTVTAERLPERIRKFFWRKIEGLQPRIRQLIEVSAVIGPSVAVEDVAEMLGQSPAVVLPSVNKALAVGILVADGATLTFRDSMTWRAITEAIPEPISRALHRQFGQLLLDRGNELQAAGHLVRGARQDDRRALQEMDRVVGKLLPSAPQAAADLAMRAVELTLPEDPARAGRLVMVVRALTAEQRPQEAMTLIDESLAMPLPPLPRAELRIARAAIRAASGQPEEARAEAEELLAETDLPAGIRDEAMVVLLRALGELPDFATAEQRAARIISEPDMSSDTVVAAARALQATVRWNQGRLAAGLDLFRHAVSEAPAEEEQGPLQNRPVLDLAARLIDVGKFEEASALIPAPRPASEGGGPALAWSAPRLLRARIHLAAGRIDDAAAEAEAVLQGGRLPDGSPHAILARCMLATIALRRGDLVSASQLLDSVSARLTDAGPGWAGIRCQILAAQVAEARDGPAAAMSIVEGIYEYVSEFRWPLIQDPAVAPWLVRLALAAGDNQRAALVGSVAEELGHANRAFPIVTAACLHAQGLLTNDIALLQLAAETQPDVWASASAAEDLAGLLADADRVADAIGWFDHAYANFQKSGASRDAARVRGQLRRLGVQRRHWRTTPERSGRGVDSLTETERGIAELVCQGLTNRQIAEQTFVSANTIAFHLRNIYRKLGITSRVQLARVVLDSSEDYT